VLQKIEHKKAKRAESGISSGKSRVERNNSNSGVDTEKNTPKRRKK